MCVKKKIVQQDRVFIGAVYWGIPCTFYGGHSVGKFTAVQDLTVGFYAFRLICYSVLSQDGLTLLKVKKLILNSECYFINLWYRHSSGFVSIRAFTRCTIRVVKELEDF